ncbi:MAG TPA: hypothetical protein O0W88_04750 [Methanocorpusculum sp.]|nr:hypothetical protein [Methanocorpusculum sp.]
MSIPKQLDAHYNLPVFKRNMAVVWGKKCHIWDNITENPYLDLVTDLAVCNIRHSHSMAPEVVMFEMIQREEGMPLFFLMISDEVQMEKWFAVRPSPIRLDITTLAKDIVSDLSLDAIISSDRLDVAKAGESVVFIARNTMFEVLKTVIPTDAAPEYRFRVDLMNLHPRVLGDLLMSSTFPFYDPARTYVCAPCKEVKCL